MTGSDTSVYTATFGRDNADMMVKDLETLSNMFITGNGTAMYSNRISHFYDLRGPSVTIDTGCSGSLASIHMAVQNLRSGESKTSIVAASGLLQNPDYFIALSSAGVLSSEGRCFSWDHRSCGYGRGEGVSTLVLKRLSTALEDGDTVHAVIRESSMNQDGKTGTITSPSMAAQQEVIEKCYRRAGLDMSSIGYVEAHMTGTGGDPIEAESIGRTLGASRDKGDMLFVGSIKTNVGHTEAVSGLASVIKTCLILKHQLIPPNLNYEKTNPSIPLDKWNLQVPTEPTAWPKSKPLRASINNFGYGGTNVHLILEGSPRQRDEKLIPNGTNGNSSDANGHVHRSSGRTESLVYIVSAKDATSLTAMSKRMATHVRDAAENENLTLYPSTLAYNLGERRSRFEWTTAVKARSLEELAVKLEELDRKSIRAMSTTPRIGFVFSGQGAQWFAMGRELLDTYQVFQNSVDKAAQCLRDAFGASWSFREELLRDERTSRVHDAEMGQPMTVALQLCLVDLLRSWKITPTAVVSHSSGEIAAAYAAEVLSFEEALGVAYFRGLLAVKYQARASGGGGMVAVGLSAEEAEPYLAGLTTGKVVLACINSPSSVTLSGDLPAIDEVLSRLEEDDVFARALKVPMAYHSHQMLPMAEEYEDAIRKFLPAESCAPQVIYSSPVTGKLVSSPNALGARNWVENLTNPVLFSQALQSMVHGADSDGVEASSSTAIDILVEIGAHDTLSGAARQTLRDSKISYVSCLKRRMDAVDTMQDLVCELVMRGSPVSTSEVNIPKQDSGCQAKQHLHNLPSYPWNHTSSYKFEPRSSKENRNKRFPPHELLGTPVSGSIEQYPTWRNYLRTQDISWLVDHQLQSEVVLPGAGYVSMAIEAVKLVETPGIPAGSFIAGYLLQNVDIMNALVIPSSSAGIESMFLLRPSAERELDHGGWYDFELWTVTIDSAWTQHCKGRVMAQIKNSNKQYTTLARPEVNVFLKDSANVKLTEPEEIYSAMRAMDFHHGPAFQNLERSRVVDARSVTDLHLSLAATESQNVLHPTTLDSIFQACYGCFPPEAKTGSMFIPRSIGNIFVPAQLGQQDGHQLLALTELSSIGKREAVFSATVSSGSEEVHGCGGMMEISGFKLQRLQQTAKEHDSTTNTYSKVRWEPDMLHNIPATMKDDMRVWLTDEELDFQTRLREACYHLLRDAFKQLGGQSDEGWQWHHKKFVRWMDELIKSADSGELETGSQHWQDRDNASKELLIQGVSAENVAGELPAKVGRRLVDIIQGQITPLDLMMEDGLLHQHYEAVLETGWLRCLRTQFRQLMQVYIAKEPGAKVLEIGAGTGSATRYALEALADRDAHGGCLLGHFDFTDISSGFFEAAKTKFADYEGVMNYARLDIEADPVEQGFSTGTYDLIIAAEVLHATTNLQRTLTNVRSLLKPGGKLVLVESTRGRLDTQLTFGVLPGWWLSEEPERKHCPVVGVEKWNEVLQTTGFSGVDFDIGSCENAEVNYSSLILATAITEPSYVPFVSIVHKRSDAGVKWLQSLADTVTHEMEVNVILEIFEDLEAKEGQSYIVALDMEEPILTSIGADDFARLRALLVSSPRVLWLSGGGIASAEKPHFAQVQGLLRALRREDVGKQCFHLDFDAISKQDDDTIIQNVLHVFRIGFDLEATHGETDWEFAVKDSILHVPRLYPDFEQDQVCASGIRTTHERTAFHSDRTLVWEASEDGLVEKAHFVDHAAPVGGDACEDGMVEVSAKAFGLNFRDVLIAMGMLTPANEDHEAAGIVTRLGKGTKASGLQVGDRVCGNFNGLMASKSRAPWTSVVKIPAEMTFEEAASIPSAFGTAYYSLITVARLQPHESVLIHSAAGGVGQAAVMLAQDIGAEVFVTCGAADKKRLLMERYHIPEGHIFSSRDASFAPALMAATIGKGVDVVLNSLAGPLLKATWECMARFGRFVEIGKMDIAASRWLDMSLFRRGLTFSAVDLSQTNVFSPVVMREVLVACVEMCHSRRVRPVHPITPFSVSDIDKAITHMRQGQHMGKLVIVPGENDKVHVVSRTQALRLKDNSGTIMIVGGLTGVGHAITAWLMNKGAQDIAVVSRHATSHPLAPELLQKAATNGCNLKLHDCDISDEHAFLQLLAELKLNMPPVTGVIQGAMVLNDAVLEHMTHEQWQAATQPKVKGTMHLHQHLPNLSFFVMLSSIAGMVGSVSQSNYCAGNTFQDALARHRISQGLPATTIDLGRVEQAGYVAQGDQVLLDRLNSTFGTGSLPLDHIYRLIEQAIRQGLSGNADDSQIVTCVPSYESLPDATLKGDKRFGPMRLSDKTQSMGATSGTSSTVARIDDLARQLNAQATSSGNSPQKASELVLELLKAKTADLFNMEEEEIDLSMSVSSYGVDSLVAVQLRNWLSSVVKANLTIFEILQSASLKQLAELVGKKSSLVMSTAASD